jgi:hypothetical protein
MPKKSNVYDNSHKNVIPMPQPTPKKPFSYKDSVKQIKGVIKTRKAILDELDKS